MKFSVIPEDNLEYIQTRIEYLQRVSDRWIACETDLIKITKPEIDLVLETYKACAGGIKLRRAINESTNK